MKANDIIHQLFDIAKPYFPEADIAELQELPDGKIRMRFWWKTNDDPSRPSKRFQPVLIVMHEDFDTSQFSQESPAVIHKEFAAFVRKKRSEFNPRASHNPEESPTAEFWIFPPEC